ncbi:MAG: histidine kinase, partial [Sphingomonadales bacterium]
MPTHSAPATSDLELLHGISVALIGEQDSRALYSKIVDAAVAIMGSQFGTMQALLPLDDPSGHGGSLNLLASHGLPPEALAYWEYVTPSAHSSCTAALKSGARAIISDFETWPQIAGTEDLEAFRRTGIRAAHTTPLLTREGELLGMISTHWSKPHQPTERDLRLMDILARQAADLLARTIHEEELREGERLLRASEATQRLLTDELSHRVKNMLATVQAIASQTHRHSRNPEDFVAIFSGRIQSMAAAHAQLSTNEWKGTRLRDIVAEQIRLGAADETRITMSGPDVQLSPEAVPKVAMMMHELGTNSIKYGALSKSSGIAAIDWKVTDGSLQLSWQERGGLAIVAPIRRGFGSTLIEQSAASAGGEAIMSIVAEGLRWDISFPLPLQTMRRVSELNIVGDFRPEARPVAVPKRPAPARPLAGKRFLVIEDEPLVAMDVADQLEHAGAVVAGSAGTRASALELIATTQADAVLLDA